MSKTKMRLNTRLFGDSLVLTNKTTTAIKNTGSIILAIFSALIVAILIATASGQNPGTLIVDLFTKAFIDWKTLVVNISVLGIGSLAFIFAYKIGLFNIGISGQMLTGGLSCLVVAYYMKNVNMPTVISQVFMLIIAISTAMLVGAFISILKIYLKVNEVVSSILINWIIFFVVRFIITNVNGLAPEGQITSSVDFPSQYTLDANGYGWVAALVLLVILSLTCFLVLKYTVFGTKMIGIGKSLNAAKYIGYNTKGYLMASFCISSGLSGVLGYVLYTASNVHNIPVSLSVDAIPTEGMNGIAIGLIAMSHPLAILPISFIIGLFQTSSQYLITGAAAFSNLIIGFLILGAALVVVFMKFKPWIWFKKMTVCKNFEKNYQKYINEMDKCISKYKSLIYDATQYYKLKDINQDKLIQIFKNDQEQLEYFSKFLKEEMFAEIERKYLEDKRNIKAQFQRHNLVDKASQIFWYKLENKKELEAMNHEIDINKLKAIKSLEEKIYDIENQTKLLNKIKALEAEIELWELENNNSKIEDLKQDIYNINIKISENKIANQNKISMLKNKLIKLDEDFEKLRNSLVNKLNSKLNKYNNSSELKLKKTYNWACKRLNKIQLEDKEKQLVQKWIDESYKQAIDINSSTDEINHDSNRSISENKQALPTMISSGDKKMLSGSNDEQKESI